MNSQRLSLLALVLSLAALGAVAWMLFVDDDPEVQSDAKATRDRGQAPTSRSDGRSTLRSRQSDDASARVEGQVFDLEHGPVASGTVTFECAATGRPLRGASRLDEEGRFEGMGCPGEVCVQLHHPSLIPSEPWLVEAGTPAELYARARARVSGRVTHQGQPVAGARISVMQAEDDPTAMPAFAQESTSSDADGRFSLSKVELPPCDPCAEKRGQCELGQARRDVIYHGPLVISVVARGFTTGVVPLEGVPDHEIELELQRPTLLTRGTLVGADGQVFPRAELLVRSDERPKEAHRVRVVDGAFEIAELASGTYTLRALQDGVALVEQTDVVAGSELELRSEHDAKGPRLRLLVTSEAGTPLPGIRVDGGPFGRGSATGEGGELTVDDIAPGKYRARLWVQGGTPKQVAFELAAGELREAKASISGEIERRFTYELPPE